METIFGTRNLVTGSGRDNWAGVSDRYFKWLLKSIYWNILNHLKFLWTECGKTCLQIMISCLLFNYQPKICVTELQNLKVFYKIVENGLEYSRILCNIYSRRQSAKVTEEQLGRSYKRKFFAHASVNWYIIHNWILNLIV